MDETLSRPYEHDDYEFLLRSLAAMKNYQKDNRMSYKHRSLKICSDEQQSKLFAAGYGVYLNRVSDCVENNQVVLSAILDFASTQIGDVAPDEWKERATLTQDHLRVNELLRQLHREWTAEGREERAGSFGILLDELNALCPNAEDRAKARVLVPGCGLARLAFDAACAGYHCLANEQSYLMLFTANFILNQCERAAKYRFYPWVHSLTNALIVDDLTSPVAFPDVDSSATPVNFRLEILAGNFLEVCTKAGGLDTPVRFVLTCFFLDSASNVVDFIMTIRDALEPGGYWLNLGPLAYVYDGFEAEPSISLSLETLTGVIESMGLKFVKKSMKNCHYARNEKSMASQEYKCAFFVCQKDQ